MKILEFFLSIMDWFIPDSMMRELNVSEKQKARMIVIAGFFGLFVPIILLSVSNKYPERYLAIFGVLWLLALYALTSFKLWKASLKTSGAICSLGLTLILITFVHYHQFLFSGTQLWFPTAILLATVIVNLKWGLLNFGVILVSVIYHQVAYSEQGLTLPHFWEFDSWMSNYKGDQILALLFNTIMIGFFLYSKEKSDQELIESQKTILNQQEMIFKKSRMAELGEVSGGFAHEINNPMTVILANAQKIKRNIQKGNPDFEKINEMAHKIEKTGNRIGKIIDGLKHYSRDASNDPLEEVNLDALFRDVIEIFHEKMYQKQIVFDVSKDIQKESIIGVYGQIFQVLVNLINNAIDALDDDNVSDKKISITCTGTEGKILISVIDSGEGIPKEIEEKVFQPFFTTKPIGKGTGLGLSISYSLMQDLGGNLMFDRSQGDSRFVMVFPDLPGAI